MNSELDVHAVNKLCSDRNWILRQMSQSMLDDNAQDAHVVKYVGVAKVDDGARITLRLLESIEHGGAQSQRRLATELGIALGLVNAYIKRCVKKGLLKVQEAPAGRYAYYLTPRGFSEKSRLTIEFLSSSFSFFRAAREDCGQVFEAVRGRGFSRIVLSGCSNLTEIATICAMESKIVLVAVVDANATSQQFLNIPLVTSFGACTEPFDAVVLTDLVDTRSAAEVATAVVGADRVFVPQLLKRQVGRVGDAV